MKNKKIFIKKHQENGPDVLNNMKICVYSTTIVLSTHVFAPASSFPVQNLKT